MSTPANPPNPEGAQAAPSTSSDPAAQAPGAPAPTIDIAAIVEQVHNRIFADLRRNKVLPEKKPTNQDQATKVLESNPAPTANLRALDRAIASSGRQLSEAAYARIEAAYQSESPADARAWTEDYFTGFGVTASTNASAPTSAPTNSNPIPASAGGAPPPPNAPLEERSIIGMSESDVRELARRKGNGYVRQKLTAELRGKRVRFR